MDNTERDFSPIPPIKAVVMDLDGTLLTSRKTVLPKTKKILQELQSQGIQIGFASGRGRASAQVFTQLFKSIVPLTLFNGSLVIDPETNEKLLSLQLESSTVSQLIQITRETPLRLHLYAENQVFLDMEDAPLYKKIDPVAYRLCKPIGDMIKTSTPIIKAMITGNKTETLGKQLLQDLAEQYPNTFYAVSSFKNHIEIMHPGSNKMNGLHFIVRNHGIPLSSMLAFGDADNDCEMIKSVGWGVAMGNGSETLKAVADDVTDDNDHDGIGNYLFRLFNLSS